MHLSKTIMNLVIQRGRSHARRRHHRHPHREPVPGRGHDRVRRVRARGTS
ncbi:MAG: hypothetical protein MZV70_21895 [Desulfobacterales bacterium]|nr:hypothetical protein [Desulfobacterales bacterium]